MEATRDFKASISERRVRHLVWRVGARGFFGLILACWSWSRFWSVGFVFGGGDG